MTTPIERHICAGRAVWVKRDDLYAAPPAPPLAKIRGVRAHLEAHLAEAQAAAFVGVFDTRVSKAGWGVAWICREMGLPCRVYYPALKEHHGEPQTFQRNAALLGAELYPMKGGRTAVLYSQARAATGAANGLMLPLGLVVPEAVAAAEGECLAALRACSVGTIVVSVGTGTILSGILLGAEGWDVDVWGVTAGMDPARIARRVEVNVCGRPRAKYRLHRAGEYYVPAEPSGEDPFPMHPYYDLKAWRWLEQNIGRLRGPVLFWNIGS